jgi:hypothetical protein
MSATTLLRRELARHEARKKDMLSALAVEINSLPDNPKIKRISPQAFIVRKKDLGNNWSVEHHDFKWCYQRVAEIVAAAKNPVTALEQIVADGRLSFRPNNDVPWSVKLHPTVVANLQKLC